MATEHVERMQQLYQELLDYWNARDARGFASLFSDDANVVGFDGSSMDGRTTIEAELSRIFTDHQTGRYFGKVREVRAVAPTVTLLRAVAGVVPAGQADLTPNLNAVQTLVMINRQDRWEIASYQNTPAAFHGRPEAVDALTAELRRELNPNQG